MPSRRAIGLIVAPAIGLSLPWVPLPGLSAEGSILLGIWAAVVVLWVTEAVPLAVTALVAPAVAVLAGVAPMREALRGFADPVLFLFIGSFLVAEAMQKHGLDERLARRLLRFRFLLRSPTALLAAYGGVTAFLSMWMSNAAVTAIMIPIAGSCLAAIAARVPRAPGEAPLDWRTLPFSTGLMLLTSFAASVGGLGTPVGTPPNVIGLAQIERTLGVEITFLQWMLFGVPLAFGLTLALVPIFRWGFPAPAGAFGPSAGVMALPAEPPWEPAQRRVLGVFVGLVLLWLGPGLAGLIVGPEHPAVRLLTGRLPEAMAAVLVAGALFAITTGRRGAEGAAPGPLLTWKDAQRIDWGTIVLFGGGISLGEMMFNTGLARWIGEGLAARAGVDSTVSMAFLFIVLSVFLSQVTSNTASASMIVPVAIAVAQAAEVSVLPVALAACLGSSFGFIFPVSTPPNALVYATGLVPMRSMLRFGLMLDGLGVIAVWLAIVLIVIPALG